MTQKSCPTGAPNSEAAFWKALMPGSETISTLLFLSRFIS